MIPSIWWAGVGFVSLALGRRTRDGDDEERSSLFSHAARVGAVMPLLLGYANYLVPDDREQVPEAYGGNAARLRVLKRRFDPDGVFTSAIPLPEG